MKASCAPFSSRRRCGAPVWLWRPSMLSWLRQVFHRPDYFPLLLLSCYFTAVIPAPPTPATHMSSEHSVWKIVLDMWSKAFSQRVCVSKIRLFFIPAQGEGLGFTEDHRFDANAVLEDGFRRHLSRWASKPTSRHWTVEGKQDFCQFLDNFWRFQPWIV